MAFPLLLPLIGAGVGAISSGVTAYQGRRSRQRLQDFTTQQMGRNLGAEAERDAAGEISALRARGAAGEKMAYRAGLGNAAERGVAAGGGVGGVSGVAQQEIDPRVADVRADTEAGVMGAIAARRRELEEARRADLAQRAAEEASRPRGIMGSLFG